MNKKYIVAAIIILSVACLIFLSSILQDIFFSIVDRAEYITDKHKILIPGLFIILASLSAMISPFSSTPLVPVAVVLWGTSLTTVLLFIGWLIGDTVAYFVGRYAGQSVLKCLLPRISLKNTRPTFPNV